MEYQIYFPAIFFDDIVQYFDDSSVRIETIINNNIENKRFEKLKQLKNSIEKLNKSTDNTESEPIINKVLHLRTINNVFRELSCLDSTIKTVRASSTITKSHKNKILSEIQFLSVKEIKATGFSDSSVDRFRNPNCDNLKKNQFENLFEYYIKPRASDSFAGLISYLIHSIQGEKYKPLSPENKIDIVNCLNSCKCNGKNFGEIFTKLQIYSIEKKATLPNQIQDFYQELLGEFDPETLGTSSQAINKVIFDAFNEIEQDLIFAQTKVNLNLNNNNLGLKALIYYRLYNCMYKMFFLDNTPYENEGIKLLMNSLHLRAYTETGVSLYPEAQIGVPVFIDSDVVIGRNCKIEPECVIWEGNYLIPSDNYIESEAPKKISLTIGRGTSLCSRKKGGGK